MGCSSNNRRRSCPDKRREETTKAQTSAANKDIRIQKTQDLIRSDLGVYREVAIWHNGRLILNLAWARPTTWRDCAADRNLFDSRNAAGISPVNGETTGFPPRPSPGHADCRGIGLTARHSTMAGRKPMRTPAQPAAPNMAVTCKTPG